MNWTSEIIIYERTKENALDKYIYELYETELKFQIEESEVKHIQTCVETLIKSLVVRTKSSQVYKEYVEKAISDCNFRITQHLLEKKEYVLSVGSFYEGTRNIFPDEFDYIVVLAQSPEIFPSNRFNEFGKIILYGFCDALRHVVNKNANEFTHQDLQLRRLIRISGPASKLEFIYKKGLSDQHLIYVDLAPAVLVKMNKNTKLLIEEHWYQKVLKTGTYLKMLFHERGKEISRKASMRISYVETELTFMTTEVSLNHKLAYRFLKYILSRQNEEMQELLFIRKSDFNWKKCDFSSYLVKTLLYQHITNCSSDSSVGTCCLDMLLCLHNRFLTTDEVGIKYKEPGYTVYLMNVHKGHMIICKDKVLAKELEQVLDSYYRRLQKIQEGPYMRKHKPIFKPVPIVATSYIKKQLMSEYCWLCCPLCCSIAVIIFTLYFMYAFNTSA